MAAPEATEAKLEPPRAHAGLGVRAEARRSASRSAPSQLGIGLDLAHRLGAIGLEAEIHEELMAAGARPRRPAITGVESLTPTELRVARLAAEGLSNREIAELIFVSRNTIAWHLPSGSIASCRWIHESRSAEAARSSQSRGLNNFASPRFTYVKRVDGRTMHQEPVVIIGAGAAGIATALSLAERGVRSVLVDRERQVACILAWPLRPTQTRYEQMVFVPTGPTVSEWNAGLSDT